MTIVLLLLLGGSAIYGGLMFILDPSGETLGIPIELLAGSPFSNYMIPGLLLFVVIGMDSLAIIFFLVKKMPFAAPMVIIQGIVLAGYLSVEVLMGFVYPSLQLPYFALAISLIGLGLQLNKGEK